MRVERDTERREEIPQENKEEEDPIQDTKKVKEKVTTQFDRGTDR